MEGFSLKFIFLMDCKRHVENMDGLGADSVTMHWAYFIFLAYLFWLYVPTLSLFTP